MAHGRVELRAICGLALIGMVLAGCGGEAGPYAASGNAGGPSGAQGTGQTGQAGGALRLGEMLYSNQGTVDVVKRH